MENENVEQKDSLIEEFYKEAKKLNFEILGLYTASHYVLSLGSDSKLIGRIFEIIAKELVMKLAEKIKYDFEESKSQTSYPDYTLSKKGGKRIAIDIKTTYRSYKNGALEPLVFTLGSYASYLRNEKGIGHIEHPYNEYEKHYVIGFIYDRNEEIKAGTKIPLRKLFFCRNSLYLPFKNVQYFMQEKYKIAGDKPASGDTQNMGSIVSPNIDDFIYGNGIFAKTGNAEFEEYWRGYPTNKTKVKDQHYITYTEFLKYKAKTNNS